MSLFARIAAEPPFRLVSYFLVKRLAKNARTIDRWGAVDRPNYLAGVLAAADLAVADRIGEICVMEFGVAGGSGLVRLQEYSSLVEAQTGVSIRVIGFDSGEGLPRPLKDFRDHPDQWQAGDYRMDVPKLKSRLTPRTRLILGNIADTVPAYLAGDGVAPVGFIACDVDLYSSATDVLKILECPRKKVLRRTFMYFDDLNFAFNHRFAGEWLAIEEFNQRNSMMKIDRWHGIRKNRVFRDEPWLDNMFIAHDLEAINSYVNTKPPSRDCALE